jgi:hypothetical protein
VTTVADQLALRGAARLERMVTPHAAALAYRQLLGRLSPAGNARAALMGASVACRAERRALATEFVVYYTSCDPCRLVDVGHLLVQLLERTWREEALHLLRHQSARGAEPQADYLLAQVEVTAETRMSALRRAAARAKSSGAREVEALARLRLARLLLANTDDPLQRLQIARDLAREVAAEDLPGPARLDWLRTQLEAPSRFLRASGLAALATELNPTLPRTAGVGAVHVPRVDALALAHAYLWRWLFRMTPVEVDRFEALRRAAKDPGLDETWQFARAVREASLVTTAEAKAMLLKSAPRHADLILRAADAAMRSDVARESPWHTLLEIPEGELRDAQLATLLTQGVLPRGALLAWANALGQPRLLLAWAAALGEPGAREQWVARELADAQAEWRRGDAVRAYAKLREAKRASG